MLGYFLFRALLMSFDCSSLMVVLSLSIIIIIPSFVRSSAGKGLNHLLVDSCDGLDAWLRFTAFRCGRRCGVWCMWQSGNT